MKKLLIAAIALFCFRSAQADSKLTALTQDTTAQSTDLIYKVDDPTGTPLSRSITLDNLNTSLFLNNYVRISTDSSVQTGGFSLSTGSFSASQDEMLSIRRQSAAGANKNALIGFYANSGGGDILKNSFGYFNTGGTGFGLTDGSGVNQWRVTKSFFPTRLTMRLYNISGSNYVSFRSSDTMDTQEYVLPNSTGTVGQVLGIAAIIPATGGNEGLTTLSWQTAGGGSGDAVLASTQTWSGINTFKSSSVFNGQVSIDSCTITSSMTVQNGGNFLNVSTVTINLDTMTFQASTYLDLTAAAFSPPVKTLTQLKNFVPYAAGVIYFCSDCTTDGIVVSTGSTIGAFGRISARTTAIQ